MDIKNLVSKVAATAKTVQSKGNILTLNELLKGLNDLFQNDGGVDEYTDFYSYTNNKGEKGWMASIILGNGKQIALGTSSSLWDSMKPGMTPNLNNKVWIGDDGTAVYLNGNNNKYQ